MERLIEAVRRYPCLWNTAAIEYRDQELKDAAWAELAKTTDTPSVKEVKVKWKKLRDSYRDALKRQSELPAGKRSYPWRYMAAMGFLQPHMGARKRPAPPPGALPDAPPDAPPEAPLNGARSSSSSSGSASPARARRAAPPVAPRARPPAAYYARDAAPAPAPAPDPIDIFFNSMCQTTKRLPYPTQVRIKRLLFNAVSEAEEALVAEQASYASLWARAASSSSSEADATADATDAGDDAPRPT